MSKGSVFLSKGLLFCQKVCFSVKRSAFQSKDLLFCQNVCFSVKRSVFLSKSLLLCQKVYNIGFSHDLIMKIKTSQNKSLYWVCNFAYDQVSVDKSSLGTKSRNYCRSKELVRPESMTVYNQMRTLNLPYNYINIKFKDLLYLTFNFCSQLFSGLARKINW